jgi:Domain of unknown function (DUF4148)
MNFAHLLSLPLLVIGVTGAASASTNGPWSSGSTPSASVGEEVWRLVDAPKASATTRIQVRAELREAQRLGLVNVGGEGDIKVATAEQQRLITLAGVRAIEQAAIAMR